MDDEPDVRVWVNADQAAGEFRVRYAELFDAEARLHEQRLDAAASLGAAEHVLDTGCRTGRSTRAAGHTTRDGALFGARTWIITARTPHRPRGRAPGPEDPGRIGQEGGNLAPPPDAE